MLEVIYLMKQIFWKKQKKKLRSKFQIVAFLLGKGSCVFLLSYQLRQPKQLQKFYLIQLKKFLQSKKYFIRLVGVLLIQWAKDTIGLI